MKNNFDVIDEILVIGMLNDYIALRIQEQIVPQDVIDEMVKTKEKLKNFLEENVKIGVDN